MKQWMMPSKVFRFENVRAADAMKTHEVKLNKMILGPRQPLVLIAGPCVIEGEKQALQAAEKICKITEALKIPFIYKSSYDKGNRTSFRSYRGPGLKEGLRILKKVKDLFKIPLCSDVHSAEEVWAVKDTLDIIQIPALLSRQTDILVEAGKTKKIINIKKGQFMAPWDMEHVIAKVAKTGNRRILLTERGTCFGYNNLVSDMRSLAWMRALGYPVIYDVTHSVQLPGRRGHVSGGDRQWIPYLARAAVGCGCDGIFMEVHVNPDRALCDGPNMWPIRHLKPLLKLLIDIDKIVKQASSNGMKH